MTEQEIVDAIRRAGYVPFVYQRYPTSNRIDVMLCNGTAPKVKWFGVLQRKLAKQGLNVTHYCGRSPYVEILALPYNPPTDTEGTP